MFQLHRDSQFSSAIYEAVFSLALHVFSTFVKNQLAKRCVDLFLGPLFCSIGLWVCFYASFVTMAL